jgi:GT2 family glycosyltransferase
VGGGPHVAIVILNWNNLEDTLGCIESLRRSSFPSRRMIVVDNGSTDGSRAGLRGVPDIDLVEIEHNVGPARGQNAGVKRALEGPCDYVLLMNNDIVVHEEMVARLVAVAERDPLVGLVGPKMYYFEPADLLWFAGGTVSRWRGKSKHIGFKQRDAGQHDRLREIDYVGAAAMLVRRAVYEQIGGENPAFFIYFNDTDFCMRAKAAGWKIVYAPDAVLWHKVSAAIVDESPYFWAEKNRSRIVFVRTLARRHRLVALAYIAMFDTPRDLIRLARRGRRDCIAAYLRGLRAGLTAPLDLALPTDAVGSDRVAPPYASRP